MDRPGRPAGARLDACATGRDLRKVAIFVSREEHCLYDLLVRHRSGELPCDIRLIVSNHELLAPVAAQFGVPFHLVPVDGRHASSEAEAIQQRAAGRRPGSTSSCSHATCASCRPGSCERWQGRAINIHHSFLPAFVGARPYHQAYERGVKLIGATAHYVTTVLDDGPIIDQDVSRASHRDSVEDLVRRGRDVERTVLARAVRWHLEDRVLIQGNRTVVFQ